MRRILRVTLTGLLALLPLIITITIAGWLGSMLVTFIGPNSSFANVLRSLIPFPVGSTVVLYTMSLGFIFLFLFSLGLLVEFRLASWLPALLENAVHRIPIVSSVYDLSQRFTSLVDSKGNSDIRTMRPVWCFFGGEKGAAVLALLPSTDPVMLEGTRYLGIIAPTAPLPFGGALIYVPESWIRPAEGGVERLINVYLSMGLTPPKDAAQARL